MMALLGQYIAEACRDEVYAAIIEGAFATNICLMEVTPECDALDKLALEARMRTASLEVAAKATMAESEARRARAGNCAQEPLDTPNRPGMTRTNVAGNPFPGGGRGDGAIPTVSTTSEGIAGAMSTQTITIGTPPVNGKPSGRQDR